MDIAMYEDRKRAHIELSLNPAFQATGLSGLEGVRLLHEALPELDFNEVSLKSVRLGREALTPFFVAAITAGHPDALVMNKMLARACEQHGWAFGVGSQRLEMELLVKGDAGYLEFWRGIRASHPRLSLFANIGASQIVDAPLGDLQFLVATMKADALVVHANPLQEILQPEGTPRFKGVEKALRRLCAELGCPVILKETGCGFSAGTLRRLADVGLAAVDVAGLGGTHWGRLENARGEAGCGTVFADWGVSTVDSVVAARRELSPATEVWGSGGVRSGLDAAKLLALGACQVGYAQPVLVAALKGEAELDRWMRQQEFELKAALFCTGSACVGQLRGKVSGV